MGRYTASWQAIFGGWEGSLLRQGYSLLTNKVLKERQPEKTDMKTATTKYDQQLKIWDKSGTFRAGEVSLLLARDLQSEE